MKVLKKTFMKGDIRELKSLDLTCCEEKKGSRIHHRLSLRKPQGSTFFETGRILYLQKREITYKQTQIERSYT